MKGRAEIDSKFGHCLFVDHRAQAVSMMQVARREYGTCSYLVV